jgi:hypothetical protein
VPEYRIFVRELDNDFLGTGFTFICPNDQEALALTEKLMDGRDVELRQSGRHVARIIAPRQPDRGPSQLAQADDSTALLDVDSVQGHPRSSATPMLKFTLSHGQPIWINLDKVIAVGGRTGNMGLGSIEGANIYMGLDSHWSVRESVEEVVAKMEQAKGRPLDGNGSCKRPWAQGPEAIGQVREESS